MRIITLLSLLLVLQPLVTDAAKFSVWNPDVSYNSEDSLDYINDKLFKGICSLEAPAGHTFCLDDLKSYTPHPLKRATQSAYADYQNLARQTSTSNSKSILLANPESTTWGAYRPGNYPSDSTDDVEGGLRIKIFR